MGREERYVILRHAQTLPPPLGETEPTSPDVTPRLLPPPLPPSLGAPLSAEEESESGRPPPPVACGRLTAGEAHLYLYLCLYLCRSIGGVGQTLGGIEREKGGDSWANASAARDNRQPAEAFRRLVGRFIYLSAADPSVGAPSYEDERVRGRLPAGGVRLRAAVRRTGGPGVDAGELVSRLIGATKLVITPPHHHPGPPW